MRGRPANRQDTGGTWATRARHSRESHSRHGHRACRLGLHAAEGPTLAGGRCDGGGRRRPSAVLRHQRAHSRPTATRRTPSQRHAAGLGHWFNVHRPHGSRSTTAPRWSHGLARDVGSRYGRTYKLSAIGGDRGPETCSCHMLRRRGDLEARCGVRMVCPAYMLYCHVCIYDGQRTLR